MNNPPTDHLKATQFEKGKSGNPKGRAKGSLNTATVLRKIWETKMDAVNPKTKKPCKMTVAEIAMFALAQRASKGDVRACQEIMDRLDGKVAQPMEHGGVGGVPLAAPIINVIPVEGGVEGE